MPNKHVLSLVSVFRERSWMVCFLWTGVIEGFLLSLFLLFLPSNPENRVFIGLTRSRLIILFAILFPSLVVLILAIKSLKDPHWSLKWSSKVMDERRTIPRLSAVLLVTLLMAVGWVILFRSGDFMKLNQAYLVRLAPPLVWVGLLWIQLWLVWLWTWKWRCFSLPDGMVDVLASGFLFLIAFWSRVNMTSYDLPYQSVWDEVVTYFPAMNLLAIPGLKPNTSVPGYGMAAYGDSVTYIATLGELIGFFDGLRAGKVFSVQEYLSPPEGVKSILGAVHSSGLPLQAPRMVFSLINSLAPVGIYFALRNGLSTDRWSAFGGGFIYALLSKEVIYYSSYMLPDALTATVLTFLIITAWKSMENEKDRLKPFLISGLLTGVIISITIRVLMVVVIPLLALLLSRNRQRFLLKLFVIVVCIAGGFCLGSPYALLDLPSFLAKVSAFTWSHDLSLANRLAGLVYYFQGAFMPGANSPYVGFSVGSVGLGPVAGFLAALGIGLLILRSPRHALIMIAFTALQLFMISSIQRRYTRHALVLYPIICIFAGAGLSLISEWMQVGFKGAIAKTHNKYLANLLTRGVPAVVLAIFLFISAPQLLMNIQYIYQTHNHKAPQVQAAEYLSSHMQMGDRVGILDEIPWVESDLDARGIPFVRIQSSDTFEDLKAKHINLVAGTDDFGGDYTSLAGTIWENGFQTPEAKLAEFGTLPLMYDGYPAGQLYIFVARVP